MKRLTFLIVAIIGISFSVPAQKTDSLYIVVYTTGKSWDHNKQAHEQPYFKEHSSNLSALRKSGTIKAGARYGDKGMIVIAAPDLGAATKIIHDDIAVQNHLFDATVDRLFVFYEGCLEKPKSDK